MQKIQKSLLKSMQNEFSYIWTHRRGRTRTIFGVLILIYKVYLRYKFQPLAPIHVLH